MSTVSAGVRRIRRSMVPPRLDYEDETRFAPHAPDDAAVLSHLFHVEVDEEAQADMPAGSVVTPYGIFGAVEHVAGRVDR